MTCKHCIHFDACLTKGKTRYYGIFVACDDVEERCKFFKSKADVVEVRHGAWEMRGGVPRCSECDEKALEKDEGGTGGFSHEYVRVKSNYCPYCGAKMDGKEVANNG